MTTGSLQSQPHRTPKRRYGRRRQNLAAAIFALTLTTALSLTGCTSKGSPPNVGTAPTGPATATAPATAAPTTSPAAPVYKPATANGPAQNVPVPILPAKAKEFSKTGLEEFARYWYSTLGYVFETGDPKPMMAITDSSCETCANINGPVSEWYKGGGWISGGRMKVYSATSAFAETQEGAYQATLMIEQSPVSYYNPDKSLDTAYPPTNARGDILVATYSHGHWIAQTAEHLSKD